MFGNSDPFDSSYSSSALVAPWDDAFKWNEMVFSYIAVESCWHVCFFGASIRLNPISLLIANPRGKVIFEKLGQKSQNFLESPWKRTATEWFILNKLIGIPLFPAKLALGVALSKHYSHKKQKGE
jgi:hypothetical protein